MDKDTVITNFIKAGNLSLSNYLLDHYADIGMNNEQLLLYIHLKKALERGQQLPDLKIIATQMHMTKNVVANILQSMITQGLAEIKNVPSELGQRTEQLNFDGLYNQLLQLTPTATHVSIPQQAEQTTRQEVFAALESEFRRPLSTFELQTVSKWFDEERYDPTLILMALKEAVLNGVYNFRYIEQILLNWRQKNVQTELDVAQHRAERQKKMQPKVDGDNIRIRNIPYIDIMNLDED